MREMSNRASFGQGSSYIYTVNMGFPLSYKSRTVEEFSDAFPPFSRFHTNIASLLIKYGVFMVMVP